jgi:hypothetical protein
VKTPIILQIPNASATVGDDGWAQLAPFGTFAGVAITADGPRRAQQIVDPEAAAALINSVKSLTGRASRFFRSIPIYNGHPDAPGMETLFPDADPKGSMADIQARENGIYVRLVLNESGAALVNGDTKIGLSAFVDADIVTDADGTLTARWSRLRSIGLTPDPNLPVQMLNQRTSPESDRSNTPTMNQQIIIAALVGAGVQIANSATEDQVVQSIRTLAEKAAASTQLANARETDINRLNTEVTTLKQRVTETETQLANTQGERIKDLLDERVTSGAIPESDRSVWESRLKANFANEAKALRDLKGALKTQSTLANGGARRVQNEDDGTAERYVAAVIANVAEKKPASEAVRSAIASFPNSYAAWREAGCPTIPGI